jgi:hypothetical protein
MLAVVVAVVTLIVVFAALVAMLKGWEEAACDVLDA